MMTFRCQRTPNHHKTISKHYQNHIETSPQPPQGHHPLCSVSLGAQAKFLSQNEVGTSMRRCLRDFYAVGTPMASSNHLLLDAADRQHQATQAATSKHLEPLDVRGRDRSRHVGGRCGFLRLLVVALCRWDRCRGMPRLVATCRDRSYLLDVGNVLVHRRGRDEIFFAECGLDAAALKMAFGAVALNAARSTGEACASVALDGLLDGKSEITVGAGRDLSRQYLAAR